MKVTIIERDIHGRRLTHNTNWHGAYIIAKNRLLEESDSEILLILVDGACIYSAMWAVDIMDWESVTGFFA